MSNRPQSPLCISLVSPNYLPRVNWKKTHTQRHTILRSLTALTPCFVWSFFMSCCACVWPQCVSPFASASRTVHIHQNHTPVTNNTNVFCLCTYVHTHTHTHDVTKCATAPKIYNTTTRARLFSHASQSRRWHIHSASRLRKRNTHTHECIAKIREMIRASSSLSLSNFWYSIQRPHAQHINSVSRSSLSELPLVNVC